MGRLRERSAGHAAACCDSARSCYDTSSAADGSPCYASARDACLADPVDPDCRPSRAFSTACTDVSRRDVAETFDTFEAATGNVNELVDVKVLKTKSEFWKGKGFTEKWIGQNEDSGEWYSAFRNPKTGEFSRGKESSHRE